MYSVGVQLIILKLVNRCLRHRRKIDILSVSFSHGSGSTLFSLKTPSNSRREVLFNSHADEEIEARENKLVLAHSTYEWGQEFKSMPEIWKPRVLKC